MDAQRAEDVELTQEANRLYWSSDTSVNQIAESLGLSKGSLYSLIEPLPAGFPCPRCGSETMFPNRTARDRGFVACPSCGFEEEEESVREEWHESAARLASGAGPFRAASEEGSLLEGPSGRLLMGTALLGLAAGVALTTLLRRR